jgi:capsular polysaccharide biosynthesis protein
MELRLYLEILRRRWPLVVGVPLLVALLSLGFAVMQPPRYGATARLLVTRPGSVTVDVEDTLAYDLPAIVGGEPFALQVTQELARRGYALDPAVVERSLHGENQKHVVSLSATTSNPADAVAIVVAAVALIKTNGLRYWGDPDVTPARPGIDITVLSLPAQAVLLNGPRAIAQEVGLRALLGLTAAVGAAFALHYLDQGRMMKDERSWSLKIEDGGSRMEDRGS